MLKLLANENVAADVVTADRMIAPTGFHPRSHGPRGNALFDAPRRLGRKGPRSGPDGAPTGTVGTRSCGLRRGASESAGPEGRQSVAQGASPGTPQARRRIEAP